MKPPRCRLCGQEHWTREGCKELSGGKPQMTGGEEQSHKRPSIVPTPPPPAAVTKEHPDSIGESKPARRDVAAASEKTVDGLSGDAPRNAAVVPPSRGLAAKTRAREWNKANRQKYNERQREYMKKRRGQKRKTP